MSAPILTVAVKHEDDVVGARQRARQLAALLGFDVTEQTRIATAVSEIARNAFVYAAGGRVEFLIEGATAPQLFLIRISDRGKGIGKLADVLSGRYKSATGMGLGIVGARRLMDQFDIASTAKGTIVTLKKIMPRRSPLITPAEFARIGERLESERPAGPIDEVRQQNQELLRTLEDLNARQQELVRLNRELEDTNRGVVALYAELDERADHLRRADEVKTRFLSNMTHEFRTPVNSILALTALLSERLGTPADTKDEVFYIRQAAQQLSDIVNDLLDLAKVEAGKIEVRAAQFEVSGLFGALRGMLRPLLINQSLALIFDEPEGMPPLHTDESKVSQVLRNFISNALKYTERGHVRVSAQLSADRTTISFHVADTGIGIPATDLHRIFEEFVQIENPLQRRVKGTGLGLPLSKRLAELLGGTVSVESQHGVGSTFTLTIPILYRAPVDPDAVDIQPERPGVASVLVVEDSDEAVLLYERALDLTRYQLIRVRTVAAAERALASRLPAAIILDLRLYGEEAWDFLAQLKRQPTTAHIPVIVCSAIDDRRKGFALGADAYTVKPVDTKWLARTLGRFTSDRRSVRVLTVDDEEASRFIIRQMLNDPEHVVIEAASGSDGLLRAHEQPPDVILLDLRLTDMTGFDVFERLRADPTTAGVPVVVVTSQRLSTNERDRLAPVAGVLSKSTLTRDSLRRAIAEAIERKIA
ncbi:MAG TPA: ATP-binding protein [Vicinamibacterales bacterium]|nr:ATP-binding protein [Vicinamibacterales bacterium]